jgi:hypothetical protein
VSVEPVSQRCGINVFYGHQAIPYSIHLIYLALAVDQVEGR